IFLPGATVASFFGSEQLAGPRRHQLCSRRPGGASPPLVTHCVFILRRPLMSRPLPAARPKLARAPHRRPLRPRLGIEPLEVRAVPAAATAYIATDLVSDQPGAAPATDSTLPHGRGSALDPNS